MTPAELRAKFEAYRHGIAAHGYVLNELDWIVYQDAYKAAHASRDAEVEALKRDAERYRALEKMARQKTAYDVYGNGAHWTIGLFSDDSRMTFAEVIDAAMTK